jgi:hypothetical protein
VKQTVNLPVLRGNARDRWLLTDDIWYGRGRKENEIRLEYRYIHSTIGVSFSFGFRKTIKRAKTRGILKKVKSTTSWLARMYEITVNIRACQQTQKISFRSGVHCPCTNSVQNRRACSNVGNHSQHSSLPESIKNQNPVTLVIGALSQGT